MADNSEQTPPKRPEAELHTWSKPQAWDMGTLFAFYIPEPRSQDEPLQPGPSSPSLAETPQQVSTVASRLLSATLAVFQAAIDALRGGK